MDYKGSNEPKDRSARERKLQSLEQTFKYWNNREHELKMELEQAKRNKMQAYDERRKVCDHKWADGTSAWEDNYAYGWCRRCGYDDL